MRSLIAFIVFVLSIAAGLYVGVWLFFIGGIVDIIDVLKSDVWTASQLGVPVLKIIFASFAGTIVAGIGICIARFFAER